MTTYNDKPILSDVGFYTSINTGPGSKIKAPINAKDVDRVLLEFTLTGLEHETPPGESIKFAPFYINIAIINVRGGKEAITYKIFSQYVNTYNSQTGDKTYSLLVDLIDEEMKKSPDFWFNLSYAYLMCTIFYSDRKIVNEKDMLFYMNNSHYVLYNSKLPIVGE